MGDVRRRKAARRRSTPTANCGAPARISPTRVASIAPTPGDALLPKAAPRVVPSGPRSLNRQRLARNRSLRTSDPDRVEKENRRRIACGFFRTNFVL